jgi:hypothetical protein
MLLVAVIILLLIIIAVFCWWRKRKERQVINALLKLIASIKELECNSIFASISDIECNLDKENIGRVVYYGLSNLSLERVAKYYDAETSRKICAIARNIHKLGVELDLE